MGLFGSLREQVKGAMASGRPQISSFEDLQASAFEASSALRVRRLFARHREVPYR